MASQIEQWFRLADEDRDGGVGGAEAVRFFTKSGLPQDVLGQIWEFSSGGAAKLNIMQFGVAMRLVALAQASGNRLDPNQARVIAMGGGPQLPPPRLAGITGAPAPSIATYTPQITGLGPQASIAGGPTGGPYVPQSTGGPTGTPYVPQPTGGYVSQGTGGPRPPLPTGYTQPHLTGMRPPVPASYTAQLTGPGSMNSGPPSGSGGFSATAGSGPPSGGYPGQQQGFASAAAGPTGQGFGASTPGGSGPPSAGYTGQQGLGVSAGPTGGIAGLPGFPPVTPADMQRYQATFMQTDTDRDGLVKGAECFPVFMLSGLDKALLKRMWDMVAGNAGSLNVEQFMKCMYIMDGCRRGAQLPAVLPAGHWPQVTMPSAAGPTGGMQLPLVPGAARMSASGTASISTSAMSGVAILVEQPASAPLPAENWSLENQFGPKGAQKAIADAYDQTLPRIPELPGKFTFDARPPSIGGGASIAPDLDAAVADMLAPADKARWEAEHNEALEKERRKQEAEAEAAAAKARIEAFQQALSELIMFKSRVDVALLQASDTAARLNAEAEDTELRYNRARLAAQSQEEEGNAARQKLQALLARKQEAANKLELLQQELAMMQNLNPAELIALEKEVGKLVAEAAAAESKKAAMEMQLDSGKKQKSLLADRISDLEMAAAAGEGDIRRAREELEHLQAKVSTAEAAVLSPEQLGDVGPLLGKAASAYRRLYSSAAAAGIEVPYEANLNNVGALVWLEQLLAGAADWVNDDSLVSGYTVVNAFPDLEGVPPALLRAAALAAEQQQPIKPAALMAGTAAAAQQEKGAAGPPPPAAAAAGQDAKGPSPAAAAAAADAGGNHTAAAVEAPAAAVTADAGNSNKPISSIKGAATAAVAAVTAAAAATITAVTGGVDADDRKAAADVEQVPVGHQAEGEQVPAAAAAGTDATAAAAGVDSGPSAAGFEDDAFGEAAAFPAAAEATPAAAAAESPLEAAAAGVVAEVPPVADGLAAAADMFIPDAPAAAEAGEAAAAAAAAEDLPASASEAAAAAAEDDAMPRRSTVDEDDSDIIGVTSPFTPEALSAVPAVAGGLGLAGFDPALYRLDSDQRQLAQQQSMDSSYAGSMTGGSVAAGVTGASTASGFEDDAFGSSSGPGSVQHKEKSGQGAAMAFEDNAF